MTKIFKNDDGYSIQSVIFFLIGLILVIPLGLVWYSSYSNVKLEETVQETNTVVLNEAMLLRANDANDKEFVELITNNSDDKVGIRFIDDEGKRSFQPGETIIVETFGYVNGVEKYNSVSSE